MKKKSQTNNRPTGFTLIEIMIASALLAIVIVATYAFWYFIQTNYQFSVTQYMLTDGADQALRQISTEIRQAEVAANGAYPLEILEDNQLAFYTDTNKDGNVERRRYFIEGTTIKKGVLEPSGSPPSYDLGNEKVTVVVEGVDLTKLPLFGYYNSNWPGDEINNPLAYSNRPLETRLIRISIPLKMTDTTVSHGYSPTTVVQVRNLKSNW